MIIKIYSLMPNFLHIIKFIPPLIIKIVLSALFEGVKSSSFTTNKHPERHANIDTDIHTNKHTNIHILTEKRTCIIRQMVTHTHVLTEMRKNKQTKHIYTNSLTLSLTHTHTHTEEKWGT